jgi:hypothetical protein
VAALVPSTGKDHLGACAIHQAVDHKRLYDELHGYGKTRRTRPFSEPQSASRAGSAIESKIKASAAAAGEEDHETARG